MKTLNFLFLVFLTVNSISAEDIVVSPQGQYAEIDVYESNDLMEILNNNYDDLFGWKKKAARTINQAPGSYHPPALMAAGIYYLKQKDFEQAAPLCIGALSRTDIDILISKDKTVGDAAFILMLQLENAICESIFTDQELKKWNDVYNKAFFNFEIWDRKTPRNYDDRWIRLHSMRAFTDSTFTEISDNEKWDIIEQYYLQIKGIESVETLTKIFPYE